MVTSPVTYELCYVAPTSVHTSGLSNPLPQRMFVLHVRARNLLSLSHTHTNGGRRSLRRACRPRATPGWGFRVQGSGCRVQGAGCRVQGSGFRGSASGGPRRACRRPATPVRDQIAFFRSLKRTGARGNPAICGTKPGNRNRRFDPTLGAGWGFRVQGAGCRVQGSGFRVQGSGCRVQGAGFRIQGSEVLRVEGRVGHVDHPPGLRETTGSELLWSG